MCQQPAFVSAQSNNTLVSLDEAQRLIASGHFKEAEEALRVSIAADPRSGRAHYLLAYTLLRQDRAKEALDAYTQAAAAQAPSAEDLKNVGQAYVLLDDYADASKWMTRAAEMDPNDPEIWYGLGRLRYSEQKYSEAADCFSKTLALAPKNVKAENNLGLAYEGLNRPEDAVLAYRTAIAWQDATGEQKVSEQPLLNLGTALLHQGKLSEAEPLLAGAAAIAPADARIREQLGQLYMKMGSFTEAAKEFEQATQLSPQESHLHFLLGQAYRRLGRQPEAKAQFDLSSRLAQSSSSPDHNQEHE